jgi:hypothetical protein
MGSEDASILTHLLVLEDRTLLDEVSRAMAMTRSTSKRLSKKWPIDTRILVPWTMMPPGTCLDMRDVTERVLNNLLHRSSEGDLQHLVDPVF